MQRRAITLTIALTPVLALTACGSRHEEDLERQLEQTRHQLAQAEAAQKAAEAEAKAVRLRSRQQSASLAAFYSGADADDSFGPDDEDVDTTHGNPGDTDKPPAWGNNIRPGT